MKGGNMFDPEEIRRTIAMYPWHHRIDLGNGIITPGISDTFGLLEKIGLPANLEGKTVLDIGACDGFFSFEAERRNAKRVLAIDLPQGWGTNGYQDFKCKFDFVHAVLNSRVESEPLDVYDLSVERVGRFDLVLFLGVLYHLKHPLLALEKIFSVTAGQLILETHIDLVDLSIPAAAFYPDDELNNDCSNWWGPNEALVIAMLKTVGFKRIEKIHSYTYKGKKQGRAVFHAYP